MVCLRTPDFLSMYVKGAFLLPGQVLVGWLGWLAPPSQRYSVIPVASGHILGHTLQGGTQMRNRALISTFRSTRAHMFMCCM
jgi:hypothetical protein